MLYRQHQPAPDLAAFVRNYWTLNGAAPEQAVRSAVERVIPDGRSELILHLGDPFACLPDPASPAIRQPCAIFAGQTEAPVLLQPTGVVAIFGVTFESHGAFAFNRVPQAELANRILPVRDAWSAVPSPALRIWEESMRNAASDTQRIALTDRFLRSLLPHRDATGPRIQAACRILREDPAHSIDRLATLLNVSRRQLERDFHIRVGIRPKVLAGIARVQKALLFRQSHELWTWSQIAQEAGYYDQAHLIADFRRYTGTAPTLRQGDTALEQAFVRC